MVMVRSYTAAWEQRKAKSTIETARGVRILYNEGAKLTKTAAVVLLCRNLGFLSVQQAFFCPGKGGRVMPISSRLTCWGGRQEGRS